MKHLVFWFLALACLISGCQQDGMTSSIQKKYSDSATIYHEMAWQEMFTDSLMQAETHAYRAFMLSQDSTLERGALSLLCYIYYREGKQQELQLLMQTLSPDVYMNVMDVQMQVEHTKAAQKRQLYAFAVIFLLLLLGCIALWYLHRIKMLSRSYQQRIVSVRHELTEQLKNLGTTPSADTVGYHHELPTIQETKIGIDVLFAIINDQNISQMGKAEEQALLKAIPLIDSNLTTILEKASSTLTPKETFFCVMEYYGKTDKQKARSFCCSEQAVRSTKSRLNKKMDINVLRPE